MRSIEGMSGERVLVDTCSWCHRAGTESGEAEDHDQGINGVTGERLTR
jgi:hypothetical protein